MEYRRRDESTPFSDQSGITVVSGELEEMSE